VLLAYEQVDGSVAMAGLRSPNRQEARWVIPEKHRVGHEAILGK